MTLPASGQITFADIQAEFGGSNPIALNEYYAGGPYVPAGTAGVPSSGAITFDNFHGASNIVIPRYYYTDTTNTGMVYTTDSFYPFNASWNGSVWCAVGSMNKCVTSPDGITWTTRTIHAVTATWTYFGHAVALGTKLCVHSQTFGTGGASAGYRATSVNNGVNWTAAATTQNFMGGIASNGSIIVGSNRATGTAMTVVAGGYGTSTDGVTYTSRVLPAPMNTQTLTQCFYNSNAGLFVIFGPAAATQNYAYSGDGINWTTSTIPAVPDSTASARRYGCDGGRFWVKAYNTTKPCYLIWSDDGVNWSSWVTLTSTVNMVGYGPYYCGNGWLWMNTTTGGLYWSPDMVTWYTATLGAGYPSKSAFRQTAWTGTVFSTLGTNSSIAQGLGTYGTVS